VMLPGPTAEAAMERWLDDFWQMMWKYDDMEASASRSGRPARAPSFRPEDRARLFGRSALTGTPEQIVESLLDLRRRAGVDVQFVARSVFPTLSFADQVGLLEELAEGVGPHI